MNRRQLIIGLSALAVTVGTPMGFGARAGARKGVLSAPEARDSMQQDGLLLLDIRRPSEWRDTGIAEGATALSMHDPAGPPGFLQAVLKAVGNDRDRPVALICASGVRSSWAQRFLQANGFTRVENVIEGMLGRGSSPGWIRRGLPVSPCSDCGG